jgi:hypothetical protein
VPRASANARARIAICLRRACLSQLCGLGVGALVGLLKFG